MERKKFVIGLVGGATAVVAVGAVGTHLLSGTESTTGLDQFSKVQVDGVPALSKAITQGRIASKYHPLPWVGVKLIDVSCPTGLKAVAGASVVCTGQKSDGGSVEIPVHVVKAGADSVTWTFER